MSTGGARGYEAKLPSDRSADPESPGSSQLDWLQGAKGSSHTKNINQRHNLMCLWLALGDSFAKRQELVVKRSETLYTALFIIELTELLDWWPVMLCNLKKLHISQGYELILITSGKFAW